MTTFFGTDIADIQTSGTYNDMYGAGGNDNLVSAGGTVEGGAGNDIIGLSITASPSVLAGYGGEGNDTLVGYFSLPIGSGDVLYGGSGDDILNGDYLSFDTLGYADYTGSVGYADYLDGGPGKDSLNGQGGNDILYGGDGDDTPDILYGGGSYYFLGDGGLFGGDGDDYLDGGRGNDVLVGGNGNDYLTGGQGNDILQGGNGNDIVVTGEGADQGYGGAGDDYLFADYTVWTTSTFAKLYGDAGADTVVGGDGADTLGGDQESNFPAVTGNDLIWARGGNDTLYGGAGSDNMVGGTGNDSYYGGLGADYFNLYFDVQSGSTDYLMDFSAAQGDYVVLPSYAANDVNFGVYGNYAYGYLSTSAGIYLFLAANTSVADLQSHIAYY
jgi:Ca2+-binding RTX toxin-like protein